MKQERHRLDNGLRSRLAAIDAAKICGKGVYAIRHGGANPAPVLRSMYPTLKLDWYRLDKGLWPPLAAMEPLEIDGKGVYFIWHGGTSYRRTALHPCAWFCRSRAALLAL